MITILQYISTSIKTNQIKRNKIKEEKKRSLSNQPTNVP